MASRRDVPRTPRSEAKAPKRERATPPREAPTPEALAQRSSGGVPEVPAASSARIQVTHEARYRMICEAAYLRAERRGFMPGGEVEDWLAAEQEVDRLLKAEHVATPQ